MTPSEDFKRRLSELLLSYRKPDGKAKMSQRELSELIGLQTHSTVGLLERGDYLDMPYRRTLEKVAVFFGFDLPQLLNYLENGDKILENPKNRPVGLLIKEIKAMNNLDDAIKVLEVITSKIRELKD